MMINDDLFKGYGVKIAFTNDDTFLSIKETLTRIGISSKKEKTLYQSCHILHKRGQYAIMHFKELFALDGKYAEITDNDIGRRNTITSLLQEWGLLTILDPTTVEYPVVPINQIKILSYIEKQDYKLESKYSIGRVKSYN